MYIVVFDLDKTLIKKNISFQFFFYLFFKKQISLTKLIYPLFKYLKYRLGILSLNKMHSLVFDNFLKNQDFNFLKKNAASFLKKNLKKIINYQVYDHMVKHLKENDYVVLMSSSPDFLVYPIAKMLNVVKCFSTKYMINDSGKISSIEQFLDGKSKAEAIKNLIKNNNIRFKQIIGFSDSIDDLPLLEICNKVYLVKPSKVLKNKFIKKQCEVI